MPRNLSVPFGNGQTMAFQVRGWSLFAGTSYEEALTYANGGLQPIAFLGESSLGSYVIGGTGSLRSDAFVLMPVPEPSTWALGIAAAMALACSRRKTNP